MKDVIAFLQANKNGFLATVENGQPRVRPFQFMLAEDGKIYFCTNNTKDVFRQLKADPHVQFSSSSPQSVWIRLTGEVRFTSDLAVKKKVMGTCNLVTSIYKSADNPIFEVFYLEHGTAVLADFSGKPPRTVEF